MERLLSLQLCIILTVFLAILRGSDAGLNCFKCNSISSVHNCDIVVECKLNEKCFTQRAHNSSGQVYTLGCQENEYCPSSDQFTLVGRDLSARQNHDCVECCSSHGCNKHICDVNAHNTAASTNIPCVDKVADCADRDRYNKICSSPSEAKLLCKRHCNLCNLVDGGWSKWTIWSQCSTTCGLGLESRSRTCSNPYPANGGDLCAGANVQRQSCFLRTCPDHGGWSHWEQWSPCSSQCGVGLKKRQRKCDNPPPSLHGHYCIGDSSDYALCNGTDCDRHITPGPSTYAPEMCVDTLSDCDSVNQTLGVCKDRAHARTVCRKFCGLCTLVDGGWTEWTEWSGCSTTCDSGIKGRIRACTNPAPANGGNDCVGIAAETSQCILRICPVHGDWSVWSEWSTCSTTCGTGLTHRRRTCDNPRPSYNGNFCFGDPVEYNLCTLVPCSVNGSWTTWGSWGTCNVTCGAGIRERTRTCSNPAPANGGNYCGGESLQYNDCHGKSCAVDGVWSSWSPWSQCYSDVFPCEVGTENATRTCTNPSPVNGGKYCDGISIRYRQCDARQSCVATVNHPTIRVVSGRLEVLYNHTWGTVCEEGFQDTDATVACKMLGYSHGWVLPSSNVPDGTGRIWLDKLACHGTEVDLFHCLPSTHKIGVNTCHHEKDIGVRCSS